MVRCQCVVERWRAIKGEIGDLIIAGPASYKIFCGVGLGRDSEIAPTGVGFHGISMGFTIACNLNQSVDRSLFIRLIAVRTLQEAVQDFYRTRYSLA